MLYSVTVLWLAGSGVLAWASGVSERRMEGPLRGGSLPKACFGDLLAFSEAKPVILRGLVSQRPWLGLQDLA